MHLFFKDHMQSTVKFLIAFIFSYATCLTCSFKFDKSGNRPIGIITGDAKMLWTLLVLINVREPGLVNFTVS